MLKKVSISMMIVLVVCGSHRNLARAQDQAAALEQVKQAKAAADAWLKLVDAANYKESWNQFASAIKPVVSEEKWEEDLSRVQKLLGPFISRKFRSAKYTTSIPGAPDGHYVVIQYDSSFANKKTTVEEVVPMLDTDGQWRVSGYHFVK